MGHANPVSLPPVLSRARSAVRTRQAVILALWELPLIVWLTAAAYRLTTPLLALLCLCTGAVAAVLYTTLAVRSHDTTRLLRALHAAVPAFEDSLELLMLPQAAGLAGLQRTRISQRLQRTPLPDLRRPVPWRHIAVCWSIAAALLLLIWLLPGDFRTPAPSRSTARTATLRIEPPAYTQLPARRVESFDAKVAAGSRIVFELPLEARTTSATLLFEDGTTLALAPAQGAWRGARIVAAATLYRLQIAGSPAESDALHRIDVITDQAPRLIVKSPQQTLSVMTPAQKTWELELDASDDYGLGAASVTISLAQGSGENIKTLQRTLPLEGYGDVRHRTYRRTLDLGQLGFGVGDDLIVRFSVADNHPAPANLTQSASYILRWPAPAETLSEGMQGLVQKTLPGYFSSERQLIIDTEGLLAQRQALDAAHRATRADELGVQQKMLRLRYGQFLGEEFESTAEEKGPVKFGDAGSVTTDYGHVHDKPGAATLFDSDTRRLLKSALDAMWQAELQLRQAQLDAALPYEYQALGYIKEVQQAERIYLARVGVALPQNDAGRRLSGERGGLSDRDGSIPAADPAATEARQLWQSLGAAGTPPWNAIRAWIRQQRAALPDALGLLAAVDHAQRTPECSACRNEIASRLWPLLPPPSTALEPRRLPSAAAQAYLDALR